MIYPKFLEKNNTIGVPAPSSGSSDKFKKRKYKNAKLNLEKKGYNIKLSDNIYNNYMARSSDKKTRGKEIMICLKIKI